MPPRPIIDESIARSAAPPVVQVGIERLSERYPTFDERIAADAGLRDAVIAVLGASRSLTQRLIADDRALDVLATLDRPVPMESGSVAELTQWRNREFLRIAARDLIGRDDLEQTCTALSDLAISVLRAAHTLSLPASAGLAVIAMGKLGGRELNYASDVDVLFVGDGDARRVMDVARHAFRIDANLRPEGRDGPLTRSLESYEAYWDRWAAAWEFQALIKAQPVAGDGALGTAFAKSAAARVWDRQLSPDDIRSLRAMKARAELDVARRGLSDREVKRGRGGIRDIEFAVQLLQLVHGRLDTSLRSPSTLPTLREMARSGYVDPADGLRLQDAYGFLRDVEHRLQLADEAQVHTVPSDAVGKTNLARVLGYRDDATMTAAARFDGDLLRHQTAVRVIHERLYFRPLLEAFVGTAEAAMPTEAIGERLAAFGFADAARTREALRELTRGLTRSSRLMQQLLPLLLDWLSTSPDPDLGLVGFRNVVSGPHRRDRVVDTFRDNPAAARRLCTLLGTSQLLQSAIGRHPDVIDQLGGERFFEPRDATALQTRLRSTLEWRADPETRLAALRRLKEREELRIATADVLGFADVERTGAGLTALAETILDGALELASPPIPMAVIGMGRFGGAELSFASDLDVLLVHEGDQPEDARAAEEAAERFMRAVKGDTPAARIYLLDADLRPEGKQGLLSRSMDGYAAYYERYAQTWERQALVRARPVAGNRETAARFMALIEPFVWGTLDDDATREIRRMKARIERERIPAGEDPGFHLKLGRGSLSDIEWTAQLLQLRHGIRSPGTMSALSALVEGGVLDADTAEVLMTAYRFCERTRNRWFLVKGAPGDSLPTQADQLAKLARSLGTSPSELRDSYKRVTRRARAAVEEYFYGSVAGRG